MLARVLVIKISNSKSLLFQIYSSVLDKGDEKTDLRTFEPMFFESQDLR